jgi:hypothetical protein
MDTLVGEIIEQVPVVIELDCEEMYLKGQVSTR